MRLLSAEQIVHILEGAQREAERHRQLAADIGDVHKNNKFREIRDGYRDAICLIAAQEQAGKFRFDPALMNYSR